MSVSELQKLNTVSEVADFCRVHDATVRRAIRNGELEVVHAGNQLRITDEAVWAWLRRHV